MKTQATTNPVLFFAALHKRSASDIFSWTGFSFC